MTSATISGKSSNRRANQRRGEIEAVIDGQRRILVLTLGGLAELETAFAAEDLLALAARFEQGRISATDAMTIIAVGLRGGGLDVSADAVGHMQPEGGSGGWIKILADLMSATFSDEATQSNDEASSVEREVGERASPNPPSAGRVR